MFPTKSGKSFGSAYVAKRKDSEHEKMGKEVMGDTSAHEAKETPEFEKGEQEGAKEAPEQDEKANPAQVVAEHGKATSIHVTHDHKAGKHHVTSVHSSGHVHHSDHETAPDAHNHASELAGGNQPESENPQAPAAPEADGFSMPRLA